MVKIKGSHQRHKTEGEKLIQRRRTARNKIRKINKIIGKATGKHKEFLEKRLEFWKSQL